MIVHALALAAVVSLGTAEPFSILGGAGVSASGPMRVTGNVGAGSGGVTGISPVPGVGDVLPAGDALKDVVAAEKKLASLPASPMMSVFDGGADDVWVIQLNELMTSPGSSMQLRGGAQSSHIFWLVSGNATLGEQSSFVGTLIAQNIKVSEGVTVSGRLIARQGTVTLATDDINLCCDPIAQSALPNGAEKVSYSEKIVPDGGTAPYIFSLFTETAPPPPGLTLASDGTLSGVPAKAGSYTFIVLVKDYKGCTSIHTYTVAICGSTTPDPVKLPDGTVGKGYGALIGAGGASFRVTELPPWVSSVPTRCFTEILLTGTPTTEGTYTIELADCDSQCITRIYTIDVHCPAITFTPPTLPDGTVGTPYKKTVKATGGNEPYRYEPSNEVSFTPAKPGRYDFPIKATDLYERSGKTVYTVDVACPPITIAPEQLPPPAVNVPYSTQLSADSLPGPYKFTATNLPAWLTLSESGLLSSPAPACGDYVFTVTAKDSVSGCSSDPVTYTLLIPCCPTITISPTTLSRGTLLVPYSKTISVTGGTPPYVITVTGSFPPGLTVPGGPTPPLTVSGTSITLSGTPTALGVYTFTVTASNAPGCPPASQTYSVAINAPVAPSAVVPMLSTPALLMLCTVLALAGLIAIRRLS